MTHSGGKPHAVGDRGQRYVVMFKGMTGDEDKEATFGWSDTLEGCAAMVGSINAHPAWHSPRVLDRHNNHTEVELP